MNACVNFVWVRSNRLTAPASPFPLQASKSYDQPAIPLDTIVELSDEESKAAVKPVDSAISLLQPVTGQAAEVFQEPVLSTSPQQQTVDQCLNSSFSPTQPQQSPLSQFFARLAGSPSQLTPASPSLPFSPTGPNTFRHTLSPEQQRRRLVHAHVSSNKPFQPHLGRKAQRRYRAKLLSHTSGSEVLL